MQAEPECCGHIDLIDGPRPDCQPRAPVNFSRLYERTFPYWMRQKPEAEPMRFGLVKFIFPNKYNIYLHDTPSKSLFSRDVRAFMPRLCAARGSV